MGFSFYTEPEIEVWLAWWAARKTPEKHTNMIIEEEGLPDELPKWAATIVGEEKVVHFMPREGWTKKSPPNYVERSHLLLGRTTDDGKLWDVLGTFWGPIPKERKERVIGKGQAGILAAYAALFEPSIKEVIIIDPPKSHMEGPHFLNVLRVLDIPEALGLLAPNVKLTLVNARDSAFDRTEEIYRLAGAEKNFVRK